MIVELLTAGAEHLTVDNPPVLFIMLPNHIPPHRITKTITPSLNAATII